MIGIVVAFPEDLARVEASGFGSESEGVGPCLGNEHGPTVSTDIDDRRRGGKTGTAA